MEIEVKYSDDGEITILIFHTYEAFGKWYADNYDAVEIIDIIQSE